jgi:hypothetical protein
MYRTWADFYQSDAQSVYALWIAPAFFLLYWLLSRPYKRVGVEPRAAWFLNVYAPLFTIESVADPYVTGPLLRQLGIEGIDATACMVAFVLIGDFRVFLLLFYVMAPERGTVRALTRAARWTMVVPLLAVGALYALQNRYGELPSQSIWILYELGFVAMAVFLDVAVIPARFDLRRFEVQQYLRTLVRYVALYYALWATADLLILRRNADWAWALRVIPNQLYYGFWMPFAYMTFFSPRYAATRMSTQRSR